MPIVGSVAYTVLTVSLSLTLPLTLPLNIPLTLPLTPTLTLIIPPPLPLTPSRSPTLCYRARPYPCTPNPIQVAYIMLPSAAQRALTPVNAPSDVALSWFGSADP